MLFEGQFSLFNNFSLTLAVKNFCAKMKLLSDEEEEAVLDFLTNEYGNTGSQVFKGRRVLCFEWSFTRTFPRNQDATVKLKSELISIKF